MDLVDRIETTRFLGNEFLAWLWFKIELFEGAFEVGEIGRCEVWLDTQLAMIGFADDSERIALRGAAPSSSPEAAEALRQGKLPLKASLRLIIGAEEYVFSFNARAFSIAGVKVPQVLSEESDERFLERMRLLEQLDSALGALYDEYLALRLSPLWEAECLPALREWVKGKPSLSTRAYSALVARALEQRKESRRAARKKAR